MHTYIDLCREVVSLADHGHISYHIRHRLHLAQNSSVFLRIDRAGRGKTLTINDSHRRETTRTRVGKLNEGGQRDICHPGPRYGIMHVDSGNKTRKQVVAQGMGPLVPSQRHHRLRDVLLRINKFSDRAFRLCCLLYVSHMTG
jgi:hypothetical protein